MQPVQLLHVENIIDRKDYIPRQRLNFRVQVADFAYEKEVDILWAGEDEVWHVLPASYHSHITDELEIWFAYTDFALTYAKPIPGNIEFAVRYRVKGKEYWDKQNGRNYRIAADTGVLPNPKYPILNLYHQKTLHHMQKNYPVTVAVHKSLEAAQVNVVWTDDEWQTINTTPCSTKLDFWNKAYHSNARNPNHYGYGIWQAHLQIGRAHRIQYAVESDSSQDHLWDPGYGNRYEASRGPFKVLALNLHCYQEKNQDEKFNRIVKMISDYDVDVICFQEVGENFNDARGDRNSNSAKIIRDRLATHYYLFTDWAHIGFERYCEGCAILSKHKFSFQDSGYVSPTQDIYDINSRKIVMAQIDVPYLGLINIYSVHLSWWDSGFPEQFENLRQWVADKHSEGVVASLICGDFNIPAGSQGYELIVDSREFEDEFLKATRPHLFHRVFNERAEGWQQELANDGRIDYIFMRTGSRLRVTSAEFIFSDFDYGRVSDHRACYAEFEPD